MPPAPNKIATSIKTIHDDSIDIINSDISNESIYKRKRSSSIVSQESEEIPIALNKSAKLKIDDEKSIGSASEVTKGNLDVIFHNDMLLSIRNNEHTLKNPSPVDHAFHRDTAFVRPSLNFLQVQMTTRMIRKHPLMLVSL